MARYIKQELPDLRKTGEKKAYYRLKTERKIDFNQFIELISSHNSGISKGEAFHVLCTLPIFWPNSLQMAML